MSFVPPLAGRKTAPLLGSVPLRDPGNDRDVVGLVAPKLAIASEGGSTQRVHRAEKCERYERSRIDAVHAPRRIG